MPNYLDKIRNIMIIILVLLMGLLIWSGTKMKQGYEDDVKYWKRVAADEKAYILYLDSNAYRDNVKIRELRDSLFYYPMGIDFDGQLQWSADSTSKRIISHVFLPDSILTNHSHIP